MEITLPITKKVVVLKEWITARQAQYINEPILKAMHMNVGDTKASVGNFDVSATVESSQREIESFIESIGGKSDAILATILDLPEKDYEVLQEKVQELRKKKDAEA